MTTATDRPNPTAGLRSSWYVALPCLLVVLYAAPIVGHRLPNTVCTLDESYEPLKTLKLISTKGRAYYKWGPMPNLVYAPLYAPLMGSWYASGEFKKPSTDYPYGFPRPFEQMGALILVARLAGLAVGVACTAAYGLALFRLSRSRAAVLVALTVCMATGPEVVFKFVATKPDGLMTAFLAASLAAYASILAGGLTRRNGVLLSLFAVFSISCKEQTAPVFLLPYAGIAVAGWSATRGDPAARRRFLKDYALCWAVGVLSYLAINVVYAPGTWMERAKEWLSGPGKDPAVWAPPGYTTGAYLLDSLWALLFDLDAGGLAVAAAAVVLTLILPVPRKVLIWLPTLSYLAVILPTTGYMTSYFLMPLNVTLALPVAAALAEAGRRLANGPRGLRAAGVAFVAAACLFNLWGGNYAWARAFILNPYVAEEYCLASVGKGEKVFTGNLWERQPGSDRLTYLGFDVDDRPLGEVMAGKGPLPDVVLTSRETLNWLLDFKKLPARTAMMGASGFSYDRFDGYEALGYRLAGTIKAPGYKLGEWVDIAYWQRDLAERQASPREPAA